MVGARIDNSRPMASISLDLDDKWSYLRTRGDARWREFPSYLQVAVPRILSFLATRGLRITFFVVGSDAARSQNRELLKALVDGGHEVGNHSYHHEPWLQRYTREEIRREVVATHETLLRATGMNPVGFRGPGFSWSPALIEVLAELGYLFDASSLPTVLAPLARMYFLSKTKLAEEERRLRAGLFGKFSDGLRPVGAHYVAANGHRMLEIPVTTTPLLRTPFHLSYLMYLAEKSRPLMRAYFETALFLCRNTGTPPSFLLHPLDFLDVSDAPELSFFPAMTLPWQEKLAVAGEVLDRLSSYYSLQPMSSFALHVKTKKLPVVIVRSGGDTR